PALLLTGLSFTTFEESSASVCHATKMLILTSGESTYQVYKWTRGGFDYYNNLRNVAKMKEEAAKGDQTAYEALALFLEAHYYYMLTMQFGDVPCSEAMQAETNGLYQPKYDSQETVLATVLTKLEEANSLLTDNNSIISGDIIYNGDLMKWRRLINAYRLRVLMSLSNKQTVGSLDVKSTFARISQNEPLMTSDADNGQLVFLDQQDDRYPYFNDSDFGSGRYMDSTYVAALATRKDPRLFAFCTQTPAAEKAGLAIDDFSSYDGGDPAIAYSLVNDKVTLGGCSKPATRYYQHATNEPMILLGYTEQQLILAEAVVRGWITGDDRALYESAVKASFRFYEKYAPTVAAYLDEEAAAAYLQGEKVAYSPSLTKDQKIERIILQKYIPTFLQGSMWMPYYDQLRTGYPEFRRAAGVNLPYRWMYPQNEYNNNAANVEAALQSQFGGNARTSDKPWWIK
ncbi:SusD/RagB family nutrient-binding outer membrane lipoprotein, partial [Alistipes indistinctus]|uniref:SusD/RagB family nutrient-binding outer membrane lipoprotein n=1 Tax=Alistipes indistinctus TaxID=626932 RepID=UPI003AB7F452